MARLSHVVGLETVIANLRRERATMGLRAAAGLKTAGLVLQHDSQRKVPVDTGNLKASAFTRSTGIGWDAEVTVGYTAAYALFVHEAVGMKLKGQKRPTKGKFWDPQGRAQAKFLEEPARTLRPTFIKILKQFTRVK